MTRTHHPTTAVLAPEKVPAAVDAFVAVLTQIDDSHRRMRNRLARDLGFTTAELSALLVIAGTENLTPGKLGEEIMMTTGAVTAMIDRLAGAGQVERIPNPVDRRSVLVTLTFRGEETMSAINGLYASAVESVVATSPCLTESGVIDCLSATADAIDATAATSLSTSTSAV